MACAHGSERRDHRRSGGNAVVQHDDHAPAGISGRTHVSVRFAPLSQRLQLPLRLAFEIRVSPEIPHVGVQIHGADFINGPYRKLGILRSAELPDQDDVQLAL